MRASPCTSETWKSKSGTPGGTTHRAMPSSFCPRNESPSAATWSSPAITATTSTLRRAACGGGRRARGPRDPDFSPGGGGGGGGPEIVDAQEQYHAAAEAAVREGAAAGLDDDALATAVRARFPDYLLPIVTPTAVARFKP